IVERRRVVLEMLDKRARLGALVEHLRLALVDTTPPVHAGGPRNGVAWDELLIRTEPAASGAMIVAPQQTGEAVPGRPRGAPAGGGGRNNVIAWGVAGLTWGPRRLGGPPACPGRT